MQDAFLHFPSSLVRKGKRENVTKGRLLMDQAARQIPADEVMRFAATGGRLDDLE